MKNKIIKIILFLISPFLSFPIILIDLFNKRKESLFYISLIFGLVSFLFTPQFSDDKARYFELYDLFSTFTWQEFWIYIALSRPDFLFYLPIYITSEFDISVQVVFFLITSCTIWLILNLFHRISNSNQPSNKEYLFFLILFLVSISLPNLFSGIRFYWGCSIVLWGLCYIFIFKKFTLGLVFIFIATFVHFSLAIFIPFSIFFNFLKEKRYGAVKLLFLISLVFLFIPRDFLANNLSNLFSFSDTYSQKSSGYLEEDDFIKNNIEVGNLTNFIRFIISNLWIFLGFTYIFASWKDKKSDVRTLLLMTFSISNFFFSSPTIFDRYIMITKVLFILLIMVDYHTQNRSKVVYIMMIVTGIPFLIDLIVMSDGFLKSLVHLSSFSLITIFLKTRLTLNDFAE